jgi:predicted HD phosphohydrolase
MKPFESIEEELRRRDPGWWDRIVHNIPELDTLAGTPQPERYHAEGDVAEHTKLAIEACLPDCDPDLLWAALLHDVGKPLVTKDEDDKITERIVWAIRHHTFHLSWNLTAPEQASQRHRRFVADQRFPLLLELLRVDSAASLGHPRGMQAYELYSRLRKSVVEES